MTNEVEIKVSMEDLTDAGYRSVMAKIERMKRALKDAGAAFDPASNIGNMTGNLSQLKQKMQSMGIADIADINQSPGKIMSNLQLIKRLIQQAGISDILDINSSATGFQAQLAKLKAMAKANPLEIKVDYEYAPFQKPLGVGYGPGGYTTGGTIWDKFGRGPVGTGQEDWWNGYYGQGGRWVGPEATAFVDPNFRRSMLGMLWNRWTPAGGGGGGSVLGGLLGGGGSGGVFGSLSKIPWVGGALGPIASGGGLGGIGVIGGIGASLAAVIAQAIGGALTIGLGGAIAAMGIKGALAFQPIKKAFHNLANDANSALTQIGIPFRPVMLSIAQTADSVIQNLTPTFQSATRIIAGPLQAFADTFMKSFEQPQVKQSIEAVASAFGKILTAITPQLPGDIAQIARAIQEMANAVAENPQAFADFGRFMANLITWAIQGIAQLTRVAAWIEKTWPTIWAAAGLVVLNFAQDTLRIIHMVGDAMFTVFGDALHWARIAADAVGQHFLDSIDNGVNGARGSFDRFFNHANDLLNGWRNNLLNAPMIAKLRGDISDLTGKLAVARAQLNDPNLTKYRRAQIDANIDQLKAAIAQARAMLASINGTVAHTYISTNVLTPNSGKGFVGKASGGVLGSGMTLVGEGGMPELIRMPGATVHSGPDTARMLGSGGGGGGGGGRATRIVLDVRGGEDDFMNMIRKWVDIDGGGDVQSAFGSG